MVQDMRWYVSPANHSADGCVCEIMSEGGGPTFAQNPVAPPDASTTEDAHPSRPQHGSALSREPADDRGRGQGGEQAIVDQVRKAKFEELLSPVCLLHVIVAL